MPLSEINDFLVSTPVLPFTCIATNFLLLHCWNLIIIISELFVTHSAVHVNFDRTRLINTYGTARITWIRCVNSVCAFLVHIFISKRLLHVFLSVF